MTFLNDGNSIVRSGCGCNSKCDNRRDKATATVYLPDFKTPSAIARFMWAIEIPIF